MTVSQGDTSLMSSAPSSSRPSSPTPSHTLDLPDASPSHARRALLDAAQEMSSRGLDSSANWALDLASCLPVVVEAQPSSPRHDYSQSHWSTPARAHSNPQQEATASPSSPAPTYPMQSTPFLGVQAPSSSSFRQDLSSPQPARLASTSNSNTNTLSPITTGPRRGNAGTTTADNSLSGRFPPPFRQPPSPLANLSFSASAEDNGEGRNADESTLSHPDDSGTTQELDESMRPADAEEDQDDDNEAHSAHVRFASEGKDSSIAPDSDYMQGRYRDSSPIPTRESTVYEYALSCFRLGQLERCKWQLDKIRSDGASPKTLFLRGNVSMLILERRAASDSVFALPTAQTAPSHAKSLIPLFKDGLIDPVDPFLLLLKGILLRKLHKRIEAMDCFVRSIATFPYNWTAWMELNAVLDTAAGELDEVLQLLPDSFMTLMFLEHHHRQSAATKDPQSNVDRLEKLLDIFPDNATLWNNLAMQRYLQRDFETAIELFEKAREIDPYLVEGLTDYSNSLFLTDRGEELAHLAHTTSEWGSETSEVCCVIGNHLYFQSDQTRAIEAFKRAIKLDPNSLGAWILLGHGYVEVKNTSAAMEMYRRAIEINPRDFRPWHGLGKVYELMEAWSFACKYYLKAAGLAPYTSQVWQSLGLTYTKLDMLNEAVSAYQRHLSCETSSTSALAVQLNCIRAILDVLLEQYSRFCRDSWQHQAASTDATKHAEGFRLQEDIVAWHCRAVQLIYARANSVEHANAKATPDEIGLDIEANPWILQSFIQAAKAESGCPPTFQPQYHYQDSQGRALEPVNVDTAMEYLTRILEWTGGLTVEATAGAAAAPAQSVPANSAKAQYRDEAHQLWAWLRSRGGAAG